MLGTFRFREHSGLPNGMGWNSEPASSMPSITRILPSHRRTSLLTSPPRPTTAASTRTSGWVGHATSSSCLNLHSETGTESQRALTDRQGYIFGLVGHER